MKKTASLLFSIFLTITAINSQENYKDLWQKVEKLEVDNLPKSALTIVEEIYTKAEKTNNSPQIIKSLFYKSKFALILQEDAQLKVIADFKKHIDKNKFPTKNVLENVLANLYWQYYQQNRWKFYNRTNTEEKVDSSDFRTWDLNTLFEEIHFYFKNSLKNSDALQKTDLYDFGDVLQIEKNSKKFRPTLYDFLAQNALNFYKTSETNLTKPAYQFKITNENLLVDFKTFASLEITSKDSLSLQLNALHIYQKLIKFHSEKNNSLPLVDVNIDRLQFIKASAVFENANEIYLQTLKNSEEKINQKPESTLYSFEIAKVYFEQANSYSTDENAAYRFKNKEALVICEKVISKFPKSEGAKKCAVLKLKINQKQLQITSEKYIPTNTFSKVLVDYKNVDSLYFSVYKITTSQLQSIYKKYNQEEKIAEINKLQKVKSWTTKLRNEFDYLQHKTEVIVPQLKAGNYLIISSTSKKLSGNKIYGIANFQSTNLTLVDVYETDKKVYQVVDRITGKPIKNATIHIKNEPDRYNKNSINKTLKTNRKGFAALHDNKNYGNTTITVSKEEDVAILSNFYLNNYRNSNTNEEEFTTIKPFIFTDRSIYRPGQTVYFKTIFIQKKGDKSKPFTNEFINIVLEDVNGQEVGNLDVKLNEFGAASGEFILPNNGITGEFTFTFDESEKQSSKFYDNADFDFDYYSNYSISVEEYKRPKFKTEFQPVTQTFKINDSIKITGFAKAFAGSNITDAKVAYRVHRKVQYPTWWYWRSPNSNSTSQEITNGEITTNSKGEFEISFKAIPDETVNKESLPVFNYEITADVTDVNGETRSATTVVKVGYHALLATLEIPAKIDKTEPNQEINIDTKNLNGEFVTAKGTIKIYKLQAPKDVLRNRAWSAPDYQDISETEFRKLFPHEPYTDNETDEKNWKKGKLVFTTDFNTEKSKQITLTNYKNWNSGKYIAVLESEDKFRQEVKDETRFTLTDSDEKNIADNQLFFINTNKNNYKIGDKVELQIGSASTDMTVVLQIEKNHKIIDTQLIHLDNCIETIKIPVKKEDIGGFAIKYHFVNFNDFKSGSLLISVPKEEERIEIETNIFRDKLQPNQEETWSFTIKNDKNDAVSAEVLASMYDASLDEFKPHSWQFNPIITQQYYSYGTSGARQSFGTTQFSIFNKNNRYLALPQQQYDSYDWFGFSLDNNRWKQRQYLLDRRRKLESERKSFDNTVSGIVSDENNEPLPGVSVTIEGTSYGTNTDFDGNYTIKVKNDDILVFSYLGYKSKEVLVSRKKYLNVKLKESANNLDEIVVVGYGTQKKKSITASVSGFVPENEQIEFNGNIDNILQGQVAGVQIQSGTGQPGTSDSVIIRGVASISGDTKPLYVVDGVIVEFFDINGNNVTSIDILKDASATSIYGSRGANGVILITTKSGQAKLDEELSQVKARTNLKETAFFYPQLKTDKNGKVSFSFTTPEALTRWKLQLLAHTAELKSTTKTLQTETQKELMVIPNAPRFLRQGDKIVLSAKISNLTSNQLNGFAQLQLTDVISGKEITKNLLSKLGSLPLGEMSGTDRVGFSVDADGNTTVSWVLEIPESAQAIQYKIVAKAGDFSDGEQNVLPVLSNRMLVTETLPMFVKSNETKTFTLDKLKNNNSTTLKNHKLTLEVTSNPAWYAIQSLPYLMEYPYECSEQTFARYYANTLASFVANSNPRIQKVFNAWKSSNALLSNLEKNKELKSLIIQETPWLRDAQSETEQKKRIALLFDLNKMKNEQQKAINKLKEMQFSSGGFPWFNGSNNANSYITLHIATGFGHLQKIGVTDFDKSTAEMLQNAVTFLDEELLENYNKLLAEAKKQKDVKKYLAKNHLSYFTIQYLYMRTFYVDLEINSALKIAIEYYQNQTKTYWNDYNLYAKGQIALSLFRNDEKLSAEKIVKSLDENSISSEELGMYWKENEAGFRFYESPIETQALMIETFSEIKNDEKIVDNLKIWLLKNKQTNQWKTTKATTEAVYALLLNGTDFISVTEIIDVKVGNQQINPNELEDVKVEAGTGYYKTSWNSVEIKPKMSEITLTKKGNGIAWAGLYWQYFEDLDKITSAETPLKLKKKLFLKVNSDTGKELKEITDDSILKVGDLITVRIELKSDRNMDFIHMKDMRASGVEPINVISKHKYQDGLWYYESTKDASTNFFFDHLPKGVYVFEYDVRVNNAGNFSNGITTIQSMYAPEFASHSEGIRVNVKK